MDEKSANLSSTPRQNSRIDPVPSLLEEAADTLKRLPSAMARPRLSSWPEVVRDTAQHLASGESERRRRIPPAPEAIDRMDKTLAWLLACDDEARRLVWARANRIPWRKLEDLDGRSHVTLRKIVARGHDQIRARLANEGMKNPANSKKPLYRVYKTG